MGILDSILGRSKPPAANLDALFAVPQAALSLAGEGFTATGVGGVCYRAAEGGAFAETETQIKQLVATGGGPTIEGTTDRFGFRWLTVTRTDSDVSGLVTDLHAANASLADAGFGSALLCSTVVFTTPAKKPMALVYLYKRGTFYPFAPETDERRDNALELQVRGLIANDVTVEADLSRWLAIWGAPGL
ncbi:hypothetical protein GCM10022234_35650 [Aeromicrobium panaciterrae]|uniref:PspA-associated protein PspAB n=1 Tax=Aeromicrobium panaciterrae TaxID=363861 RepID=UPI0031D288E3